MSDSGYLVPVRRCVREITVLKSRFIGVLDRVAGSADMEALVDEVRAAYPRASHYCYAFAGGAPGSTANVGLSDDGEPHGTAGQPMLNVLVHGEVGEVGVVVVRYFGGTKLGKGGLARAYADATKAVLEEAEVRLDVPTRELVVIAAYPEVDHLERLLAELGVVVEDRQFAERVTFRLAVPLGQVEELEKRLAGRGIRMDFPDV